MNEPTPADLARCLDQDLVDALAHPGLWRDGVLIAAAGWPAAIRRALAAEASAGLLAFLAGEAAHLLPLLALAARRTPGSEHTAQHAENLARRIREVLYGRSAP